MNCVTSPCEMRGEGGGPSVNKVSNSSEVTVEESEIGHSFFSFLFMERAIHYETSIDLFHIARLHYVQMVKK